MDATNTNPRLQFWKKHFLLHAGRTGFVFMNIQRFVLNDVPDAEHNHR